MHRNVFASLSFSLVGVVMLCGAAHARRDSSTPAGREDALVLSVTADTPAKRRALFALKPDIGNRRGDVYVVYADRTMPEKLVAAGLSWVVEDLGGDGPPRYAYPTAPEVGALLTALADSYPSLAQVQVIGQSVEGRDIMALRIADGAAIEDWQEPEVLLTAAHHGREKVGTTILLHFADSVLSRYGADASITDLVDTTQIWLVPVVNPDGYANDSRWNAHSEDLNRNYGIFWKDGGPEPYSEPETRAILALRDAHGFTVELDYHSASGYLNYVWDGTPQAPPDEALIALMSADYVSRIGSSYAAEAVKGYDWYFATGTAQDAGYGAHGILNWTIETPDATTADEAAIAVDTEDAILRMLTWAHNGIGGRVLDAASSQPLQARITVLPAGMPSFTDINDGGFFRVLAPGTYSIEVEANGYAPQTIDNVLVAGEGLPAMEDVRLVSSPRHVNAFRLHAASLWDHATAATNLTMPHAALGPPDGVFVSLGVGGFVVLDLGETTPLAVAAGLGLEVFEANGNGLEGYDVWVTDDVFASPFVLLGHGQGTQVFDLTAVPLTAVRFVKIVDDGDGDPLAAFPGFDLDAVQAVWGLNGVPVLDLIGDRWVAEGDTLAFTVSATDSDGDVLAYFAESLPLGASLDVHTGEFLWTPGFEAAGVYAVTFGATDNSNRCEETSLVTVTPTNRPPEFAGEIPDVLGAPGQELELTISATDPDGDPVSLAATDLPSAASFEPTTGRMSWTPTAWDLGTHEVVFSASDGQLSASLRVNIRVIESDDDGVDRGCDCGPASAPGQSPIAPIMALLGAIWWVVRRAAYRARSFRVDSTRRCPWATPQARSSLTRDFS
jgi:predicted deacylase